MDVAILDTLDGARMHLATLTSTSSAAALNLSMLGMRC